MDKKKLTEIIEISKESGLGKMEPSETSADRTFFASWKNTPTW